MSTGAHQRRDVERNHETILTAAIAVLADTPQATMSDIAHASGIGRSTLYRHFPDRETLIAAIYQRVFAEAGAIILQWIPGRIDADPVHAIIGLCDALAAIGERYRFLGHSQHEPVLKGPERKRRLEAVFLDYVRTHQQSGLIRSDLDGPWLVTMLAAVITNAGRRICETERRAVVSATVTSLLAPPSTPQPSPAAPATGSEADSLTVDG